MKRVWGLINLGLIDRTGAKFASIGTGNRRRCKKNTWLLDRQRNELRIWQHTFYVDIIGVNVCTQVTELLLQRDT